MITIYVGQVIHAIYTDKLFVYKRKKLISSEVNFLSFQQQIIEYFNWDYP